MTLTSVMPNPGRAGTAPFLAESESGQYSTACVYYFRKSSIIEYNREAYSPLRES